MTEQPPVPQPVPDEISGPDATTHTQTVTGSHEHPDPEEEDTAEALGDDNITPMQAWRDRKRANPGNFLPDGTDKQQAMKDPVLLDAFRRAAAKIAVDMERGVYVVPAGPKEGRNWKGPYSRWQIAEELGFNARANRHLPKIFDSPDWERYVEFERISRDANYRMAMKESVPFLDAVVGGFLMEAARRVLLEPDKIPANVLFPELRKLIELKGEFEGSLRVRPDVQAVIVQFQADLTRLPEGARSKALDLFKHEIKALVSSASEAERIIEAEAKIS